MTPSEENRIDPSLVDREQLDLLVAALSSPGHVSLIDGDGNRTEIPEPIYHHLMRLLQQLRQGQAIVMIPENETFTSQAAANFLGMSRQFFVNLIESNEIPFHHVGAHRRVYFKDLLEYQKRRDGERRNTLDELSKAAEDAGLYFPKEKKDAG